MWSLLKYLPEIFKQARARGYDVEMPINIFKAELKRTTGVMTDRTIGNWMKYLVELGYIKTKGTGIIELVADINHPYIFYSDGTPDISEERRAEVKAELEAIKAAKPMKELK